VDLLLITVIAVIVIALIFDFTNGFHDAANSVATVVATRALPARWAPAFSATFNFLAYFVVGTAVANTIAKTVKAEYGGVALAFAALFAAIAWNYATWRFGMPSSSSHAIIGGLVGAGIAAGGLGAIDWSSVQKAGIGIILSPAVAFGIAFCAMYLVLGIQRLTKLHDDHGVFKGLQLVAAAGVSFGHGANDAQKTMGVIAALLLGAGYTDLAADGSTVVVPEWAALAAYGAIALGTLWGGWKIIETMGLRITTLHANSGLAANIGATTSIFGATAVGMPISTTHAAASSIVGAPDDPGGRHRRLRHVPPDPAAHDPGGHCRRGRRHRLRRLGHLGHAAHGPRRGHRGRDPQRDRTGRARSRRAAPARTRCRREVGR
jgi:PiT family inorganic phosphate transporter